MSQSTVIAGIALAAFVLFLAANNRLTAYASVLWGPTSAPLPATGQSSSQSSSQSGGSGPLGTILSLSKTAATIAAAGG